MIIKQDCIYTPAGETRKLHIYLPDNYYDSQEKYPVMYFFDGHNLFRDEDATYGKSWGMQPFLENWSKDMIVVGMECGHGENQRLKEYLPYPTDSGELFGAKLESGTGDEMFRWIVEELKPVIDATYRTWPFRECTAIGGSSMGGLMAVYGGVHYNRWFSKAACISSSIGVCMKALMADMEANPVDPDTRMYLSWGSREGWGSRYRDREDPESRSSRWNRLIAAKIEECGATAKVYCQPNGGHSEADWEKLVPDFMHFLWME